MTTPLLEITKEDSDGGRKTRLTIVFEMTDLAYCLASDRTMQALKLLEYALDELNAALKEG